LRSQKKQILAANMSLTDAQAEKFWPVYDQYAAELSKVGDKKAALIKEYVGNYENISDDEAESYLKRRIDIEESTLEVKKKYVPLFRKVLSPRETALFFQIDWWIDLLVNVQLAQLPLVQP